MKKSIGLFIAVSLATPVQAQSLGDLLGDVIQDAANKPRVHKMQELCNQDDYRNYFATHAMGYVDINRRVSQMSGITLSGGRGISWTTFDALIEEVYPNVSVPTWATMGAKVTGDSAVCEIRYMIGVPTSYVPHFGDTAYEGTTYMNLVRQNDQWLVRNFTNSPDDQYNTSRSVIPAYDKFFQPGLTSILAAREAEAQRIANEEAEARGAEAKRQAAVYANSPAGRAEAARRQQEERVRSADFRRRGLACENSGGTWGYPINNGRTIQQVTPGDVPSAGLWRSVACYHL